MYRATVLALGAYLGRGQGGAATYTRGSLAARDEQYGVSDVDMAVVVPSRPGELGSAHAVASRRWRRLARMFPGARRLVDLAIYEEAELADAVRSSTFTADRALHPGLKRLLDTGGLRTRPGLYGPLEDWRLLRGPDRRPPVPARDRQDERMAAWLELQFLWRCVFPLCVNPAAAHAPYMCVKLVADPVRMWLWIAHGERFTGRREALERALWLMPEEEEALGRALALHEAVGRPQEPPLAATLPALVRLSTRLARLLLEETQPAGTTGVRLAWREEQDLAVPTRARDRFRALVGAEPRLLPLGDWRALAWPVSPDEALVNLPLDPCRPEPLAAAASIAREGAYPVIEADEVLILPATRAGTLRGVQCRLSDPVSFAVLGGDTVARFPNVPGWSAGDWARRAVAEHRTWLGAGSEAPPTLGAWVSGQARSMKPVARTLGRLLTAARAALFLESVEAGEPELALTMAAVADRIGERGPQARAVAHEAYACYRDCRLDERPAPARTILALRELVLELPAYAFETPWDVPPVGSRAPTESLSR